MTETKIEPSEADSLGAGGNVGLGLYVHVPFCHRKCDYCSFYSIPPQNSSPKRYLKKLEQDIQSLPSHLKSSIRTIFIGGGNPTALENHDFAHLVDLLLQNIDQASIQEWTFETNPETLDEEKAAILRHIPRLRLSMGLQRLDNDELSILGRAGSLERGMEALALACSLTARVGVDLILGVPGCADIGKKLALLLQRFPLEHVSAYFLSCEPGTPLFKRVERSEFPDPDEIGPEELVSVISVLQAHGFEQYEIANFAKPGGECLHNLHYWHGGEYLGLGPAAVGTNAGCRTANPASLEDWLSGVSPEKEFLSTDIRRKETIMLRLRLIRDGLDLAAYEKEFGPMSVAMAATMQQHIEAGLLKQSGATLRLTPPGLIIANRVISSLF